MSRFKIVEGEDGTQTILFREGETETWRNPTKDELGKLLQGPFICGHAGKYDVMELPDMIFVCPLYGLSGFAVYEKKREYSEPGY